MKTLSFLLVVLMWSCTSTESASQMELEFESEQLLVTQAIIYTVNPDQPWAEAMLIEDGQIVAIGMNSQVVPLAHKSAQILEVKNKLILPGFHDVHMHPLEASSSNFHFILNDDVDDPEDYYDDIEVANLDNPGKDWLLGWGHYIHILLDHNRPPRDILDDISIDRPIAIMERTSHSIWVNSKALEIAGIDRNSKNPVGGIVMKDSNGRPNGILIDNAGNVLLDKALIPNESRLQKDYNGLVQTGLPELAKNGITSICDARTYWKRDHHKVWQRLADEDQLTVRVNLGLWAYPDMNDDEQLAILKSLYQNNPESLLRVNQIKVYSDGIIPNTTAAMHNDYRINLFDVSPNNGLNYFTQDRLAKYIDDLEPSGFDFHIHAIGERGIHEALNAIESSGTASGRHRITHVEVLNNADAARFAELNITADCQVAGDFTQPEQWHENTEYIGSEASNNLVPIRTLLENKARLTLSSDWDVSSLNPFIGIEHAVTRDPQNISIEEAIKAYTVNAAYVMRQENKVGMLTERRAADFIILDQNIFDIEPHKIGTTKVTATYIQGKRVYSQ